MHELSWEQRFTGWVESEHPEADLEDPGEMESLRAVFTALCDEAEVDIAIQEGRIDPWIALSR